MFVKSEDLFNNPLSTTNNILEFLCLEKLDKIESKENNENYGDDPKLTEFVNQLFKMSEEIISKKDTKTAKDLIEQIRALSFRLVDEGAGVALDIAIIKQMDDLFDTHDWSDKSQARKLINDAKEIIGSNPKKETLRPIILKLWDLQPNIDSGKGLTDDTILSE